MAKEIWDALAMKRALTRITYEIIEQNKGTDNLVLIGIKTRGVYLAKRIHDRIQKLENIEQKRKRDLFMRIFETPAESIIHRFKQQVYFSINIALIWRKRGKKPPWFRESVPRFLSLLSH